MTQPWGTLTAAAITDMPATVLATTITHFTLAIDSTIVDTVFQLATACTLEFSL
jgi:hypothetical protein